MNQSQPIHLEWATGTPSWSTALPTKTWTNLVRMISSCSESCKKDWQKTDEDLFQVKLGKKTEMLSIILSYGIHVKRIYIQKCQNGIPTHDFLTVAEISNSSFSARIIPMSSSKAPRKYHTRISMGRSGILESCYCWGFRNPPNQLRLVVYPIIYKVSAPSQVAVWHFFHQQYVQQFPLQAVGIRHKYLPKKNLSLIGSSLLHSFH